ncbi:MAG: IclR family transcriptional regulator [Rhodospirillales bacterium]|nr:IclR family transcriptional regulator [Rhodospirillales bacterium]
MAKTGNKAGAHSRTLLRGLSILKCFNETNQSLSVADLVKLTKIPQPTVWRFCQTLQSEGYLTTDTTKTLFRPGLALLSLGFSAISHFDLSHHARRYLVELADTFTAVAGITSRDGLKMRIVDRHEAVNTVLSYNARVGAALPIATTASGWAYLASLEEADRDRMIMQIAKEQPDLWALALPSYTKALARFRRDGVIVSSGAIERGLTTVAIPIVSTRADAAYPLYCSAIASALPESLIKTKLAPALKKIAADLRGALSAR